jgi:hypothetical protein
MENTCIKCNETKDISLFVKNKKCKNGVAKTCNKCNNKRVVFLRANSKEKKNSEKLYREKTKSKAKEYADKYYKTNTLKAIERVNNFLIKNPNYAKESSKKTVNTATDCYIKVKLKSKGFSKEQITPELIEVQRIIIKTKRLCKTSKI